MTNSNMYKGEVGVIHLLLQEQDTLRSIDDTQDSPAFLDNILDKRHAKKGYRAHGLGGIGKSGTNTGKLCY